VSVSRRVHIPMRVGVESLNASVAAAILMYAALGPGL
jgi:tRNA G18 (ribose-2'-O)-methylase SpoU